MQIHELPFGTTNWSEIEPTEHRGESGIALWRTRQFGDIRVRMVEYSAGYLAERHGERRSASESGRSRPIEARIEANEGREGGPGQ